MSGDASRARRYCVADVPLAKGYRVLDFDVRRETTKVRAPTVQDSTANSPRVTLTRVHSSLTPSRSALLSHLQEVVATSVLELSPFVSYPERSFAFLHPCIGIIGAEEGEETAHWPLLSLQLRCTFSSNTGGGPREWKRGVRDEGRAIQTSGEASRPLHYPGGVLCIQVVYPSVSPVMAQS